MHNELEDQPLLVFEKQPRNYSRFMPKEDDDRIKTIFLAGTIDMGNSRNWQSEYIEFFRKNFKETKWYKKSLVIYNPRRDMGFPKKDDPLQDGDPYYESELEYQVSWELDHLEKADMIIMNILGDSKSPISLMELGAFGRGHHKKIYVICPKEYYRYGNVRVFCEKYGITLFNEESIFLEFMKNTFLQN